MYGPKWKLFGKIGPEKKTNHKLATFDSCFFSVLAFRVGCEFNYNSM